VQAEQGGWAALAARLALALGFKAKPAASPRGISAGSYQK
jgi:hypothetical protein